MLKISLATITPNVLPLRRCIRFQIKPVVFLLLLPSCLESHTSQLTSTLSLRYPPISHLFVLISLSHPFPVPFADRYSKKQLSMTLTRTCYIHIITLVTWSDGSDHVEWVRQERPDHTRRSRVWSGRSWRTLETWSDPSDQVTKVMMYLLYTYKNNNNKARTIQ